MSRHRPAGVLVIAIFNLLGGGMGLLGTLCGGAVQLAGGQQQLVKELGLPTDPNQAAIEKRLQERLDERLPNKAVTVTQFGVMVVLAVLMLTTGVGLLSMRPWAWGLSVFYACLSILNRLWTGLYVLLFTMPITSEVIKEIVAEQAARDPRAANVLKTSMEIGLIVGLVAAVVPIIYPIIVLVVMFHPITRAAFRGESQPLPPADEPWRPEPDDRYRAGDPS
jgi:hypothetical protein